MDETPTPASTPPPDDERLTLRDTRTERGTKYLFGKPYHWARDAADELVLLPGPDPRAVTRR